MILIIFFFFRIILCGFGKVVLILNVVQVGLFCFLYGVYFLFYELIELDFLKEIDIEFFKYIF